MGLKSEEDVEKFRRNSLTHRADSLFFQSNFYFTQNAKHTYPL